MDLAYTPEQELFRKTVRDFVAGRLSEGRLAELADGDGWDHALWKEAAALGLPGISVPEEHGGAGMGFVEEAIAAEELGRGVFPGPWLGSVVLARPALEQAPDLLEATVSGHRVATLVGLEAPLVSEGTTVTGEAGHVVDLEAADVLVVATGSGMLAVEKEAADWQVLPTMDGTRRLGRVALERAPGRSLPSPPVDPLLGTVRTRALGALAAEAAGVATRVVEVAVEYARDRRQFGKPIGAYQAVSHQIADAFMDAELSRSLAIWAAAAIDGADPEAPLAAATAKAFAAEAALRACERAIQVHGGIGFTWEHLLHRFYKRARWIAAYMETPARLRAGVSDLLLGSAQD